MKAKIDVKTAKATPVTYKEMMENAGSYKIVTIANDIFAISFGDEHNALYVSDGEVEMLDKFAWKSEMFLPLPVTETLSITFFGAGK